MTRSERWLQRGDIVRVLPRHSHDLSRRAVEDSQRWRMLEAVTEAVAKRGYADASVADVIAIAGVSRKTFYEQFRDKDACFLAAFEALGEYLLGMMVSAGAGHPAGPARRTAQLARFLQGLAADPVGARALLVESAGAGPRAAALLETITDKYARAAFGTRGDRIRHAAIVGGILAVVTSHVRAGRVTRLPSLTGPLSGFMERALSAARGRAARRPG